MALLKYEEVYGEDGEPCFNEKVTDELQQLSEIVCNNHFGYVSYHDREDLILEGLAKGIELIRSKRFDPDYGAPLKNFVYTGMRNEMTNYLYKKKKEYPVEEFYGDQNKAPDIILDNYEIKYKYIKDIIDKFRGRYGDYSGLLVNKLENMGFSIKQKRDLNYKKDFNENLLKRMVVLAIWKIREFYH